MKLMHLAPLFNDLDIERKPMRLLLPCDQDGCTDIATFFLTDPVTATTLTACRRHLLDFLAEWTKHKPVQAEIFPPETRGEAK